MEQGKQGIWIRLHESPEDVASKGSPKPGQIVEITYAGNLWNASAVRIADKTADDKVFKAKKHVSNVLFGGNL